MKHAWIQKHADSLPVERLCALMNVSKSGYYAAQKRRPSARAQRREQFVAEIKRQQARHRGRYGRRRMTVAVQQQCKTIVAEQSVGRWMREENLQSRLRRRYRVMTTDSRHGYPVAENVLARDFTAPGPNCRWVGDITYIRTQEGFLYLALIMDLFSRKLIGWALQASMTQRLTQEALQMALDWRRPKGKLLHHTDRGSQYAAHDYRDLLARRGITISMSRKGNCWDNAAMESANGTIKVECVHGAKFATRAQARQAIIEYLGYYNTERLHSSLGYMSPSEFERHHAHPENQ